MTTITGSTNFTNLAAYQPFDQFLLFGDSITQGAANQENGYAFAPALQHDYIRRLDVINRGFSGYTSSQAIVVLPHIIPPPHIARVRLMTIFFGANDAVLFPGRQHVPLEKYKAFLEQIILHPAVRAQETKLLLLTPPPVNEYQFNYQQYNMDESSRRTAANTQLYAEACRGVGSVLGVVVVDLWSAFMKAAGWKRGEPLAGSKDIPENPQLAALLSDGLHLTPDGYRIMYEEVRKAIVLYYPELTPASLPMNFPPWESAPGKD